MMHYHSSEHFLFDENFSISKIGKFSTENIIGKTQNEIEEILNSEYDSYHISHIAKKDFLAEKRSFYELDGEYMREPQNDARHRNKEPIGKTLSSEDIVNIKGKYMNYDTHEK
jgi:hypothetical protein